MFIHSQKIKAQNNLFSKLILKDISLVQFQTHKYSHFPFILSKDTQFSNFLI